MFSSGSTEVDLGEFTISHFRILKISIFLILVGIDFELLFTAFPTLHNAHVGQMIKDSILLNRMRTGLSYNKRPPRRNYPFEPKKFVYFRYSHLSQNKKGSFSDTSFASELPVFTFSLTT